MELFQLKARYIPTYILCLFCKQFGGNHLVGTAGLFVDSDDCCHIRVRASDKRQGSSTYLRISNLLPQLLHF